MRIFLPAHPKAEADAATDGDEENAKENDTPPSPDHNLGAAALVLRELREIILPKLSASASTDESASASELQLIAGQLREMAQSLCPKTQAERIMEEYPTPIALAYRTYQDAQFNVFEQVLRLRDLFESTAYFIFNVVLADAFRRLDPRSYYIQHKSTRQAYDSFSIPTRMAFIEAIVDRARSRSVDELFMVELATTSVYQIIKELQHDFRNVISHSIVGSETQQKKLHDRFAPRVHELLANLEFLSHYQLVRVDSFYWKRDHLYRRIEIFQGVATKIGEARVSDGVTPTKAPRDHLILLDEEDRVLDLHPLYQLLATPQTHDQRHLCLFKYRAGSGLHGESLFGAFEVNLDGAQDFEILRRRLETHP